MLLFRLSSEQHTLRKCSAKRDAAFASLRRSYRSVSSSPRTAWSSMPIRSRTVVFLLLLSARVCDTSFSVVLPSAGKPRHSPIPEFAWTALMLDTYNQCVLRCPSFRHGIRCKRLRSRCFRQIACSSCEVNEIHRRLHDPLRPTRPRFRRPSSPTRSLAPGRPRNQS
jgi:hypothetical protein